MVIWIITTLLIYMGFLMCLDPLINKRKKNYKEEGVDEVSPQRDSYDVNYDYFLSKYKSLLPFGGRNVMFSYLFVFFFRVKTCY